MKDKTATILRIFLAVLLVISTLLFVIFYFVIGEEFASTVMLWGYILLAITTAITIIFPIAYFISNPKKGITALIGLAGFVILYLISYYGIATGDISGEVYEKFNITELTSRFIGSMLYMTYILGALTILSIVYASISSLFK